MSKLDKTVNEIVKAIKSANKKSTAPYDTVATVKRIEEGIAWVHIPGGVDETPVKMTIAANVGDQVQVRVTGGRAFLVGNSSAPPTDDKKAAAAELKANEAGETAIKAEKVARNASDTAHQTSQYFWHTVSGDDPGTHITEIPMEEFVEDPENGKGNTLITSSGIELRDGKKTLASFNGGDDPSITIGHKDDGNVRITSEDFSIHDDTKHEVFNITSKSSSEIRSSFKIFDNFQQMAWGDYRDEFVRWDVESIGGEVTYSNYTFDVESFIDTYNIGVFAGRISLSVHCYIGVDERTGRKTTSIEKSVMLYRNEEWIEILNEWPPGCSFDYEFSTLYDEAIHAIVDISVQGAIAIMGLPLNDLIIDSEHPVAIEIGTAIMQHYIENSFTTANSNGNGVRGRVSSRISKDEKDAQGNIIYPGYTLRVHTNELSVITDTYNLIRCSYYKQPHAIDITMGEGTCGVYLATSTDDDEGVDKNIHEGLKTLGWDSYVTVNDLLKMKEFIDNVVNLGIFKRHRTSRVIDGYDPLNNQRRNAFDMFSGSGNLAINFGSYGVELPEGGGDTNIYGQDINIYSSLSDEKGQGYINLRAPEENIFTGSGSTNNLMNLTGRSISISYVDINLKMPSSGNMYITGSKSVYREGYESRCVVGHNCSNNADGGNSSSIFAPRLYVNQSEDTLYYTFRSTASSTNCTMRVYILQTKTY